MASGISVFRLGRTAVSGSGGKKKHQIAVDGGKDFNAASWGDPLLPGFFLHGAEKLVALKDGQEGRTSKWSGLINSTCT